jgi:UDP-4-amino-4,6-dideoxy-N-acetyl-beta-L-altrosamine transaminase
MKAKPALSLVRETESRNSSFGHLPYGYHTIEQDDIDAVTAALKGYLLASGPRVEAFEDEFRTFVGAESAIACSNGTAGLELALLSLNLKPGEICVVPPISFLSTATSVLLTGGEVIFCDVDPQSGLMDPAALQEIVNKTRNIRAIIPVHLGGRICAIDKIDEIGGDSGAVTIEDCCHALGSVDHHGNAIGGSERSYASVFSFHPVKMITAGEGGMVTTSSQELGDRIRRLRSHGVTKDSLEFTESGSFDSVGTANPWSYEQRELGQNFRMSEVQAALGLSQLKKLLRFVDRRAEIANAYTSMLAPYKEYITPVLDNQARKVGRHLYSVNIEFQRLGRRRSEVMRGLHSKNIGSQVHYIPIYRQPVFKRKYGEMRLPGAEQYYERTLSLPLFPLMTDWDAERVVTALLQELGLEG